MESAQTSAKKKKKNWPLALAGTVLLCLVAVCAYFGIKNLLRITCPEIRIGVILPLSGSRAQFGLAMKRGMEMAIEDINASGKLKKKLVCLFTDDRSDPEGAAKAASRLVRRDDITILIGSYSNLCTLKVSDIAEKAKIPQITPISSGTEISTRGCKWVFRTNAPSAHYALALIDFLGNAAEIDRIALLNETDNAGIDFANCVKSYAREMKCSIVYEKGFAYKTADFRPVIREAMKQKPQAFVISAHIEDALQIMRDARKLKIRMKAIAGMGSGFSLPDFITQGKKDAELTFSAVQWNPQVKWPGSREFAKKFKTRFGSYPDEHSANLYAAVQVVAACYIHRPFHTRESLRNALRSLDTETIFGRIKFENFENYTNQNSHYPLIQQVQKGVRVIVWPRDLRNGKPVFPTR
ncbi:MAG: ABC transporter substrate-binding protein [Candidatus Eremiobacteraeota bacterium]|nr:ABC transporter substrate-binding protein [Candidatus Eremiobacteraeota bacterium]